MFQGKIDLKVYMAQLIRAKNLLKDYGQVSMTFTEFFNRKTLASLREGTFQTTQVRKGRERKKVFLIVFSPHFWEGDELKFKMTWREFYTNDSFPDLFGITENDDPEKLLAIVVQEPSPDELDTVQEIGFSEASSPRVRRFEAEFERLCQKEEFALRKKLNPSAAIQSEAATRANQIMIEAYIRAQQVIAEAHARADQVLREAEEAIAKLK